MLYATLISVILTTVPAADPATLVTVSIPDELLLEVTATAYNSFENQTNSQPWIGAWGDRLDPKVQSIAVSRDLIPMGLGRGARVRIDGLPGEFIVLDKMGKRWTRKIDIYMGLDLTAARQWGRRKVQLRWFESGAASAE